MLVNRRRIAVLVIILIVGIAGTIVYLDTYSSNWGPPLPAVSLNHSYDETNTTVTISHNGGAILDTTDERVWITVESHESTYELTERWISDDYDGIIAYGEYRSITYDRLAVGDRVTIMWEGSHLGKQETVCLGTFTIEADGEHTADSC